MPAINKGLRLDGGRIEVVDRVMAGFLRRMGSQDRIRIASDIRESAHALLASVLRGVHREWDTARASSEAAGRFMRGNSGNLVGRGREGKTAVTQRS